MSEIEAKHKSDQKIDLNQNAEEILPPIDKHGTVFWITFLIGVVCIMPWNILLTVDGYWEYKFRNQSVDYVDTSEQELTKEQEEFETYLSIASSIPSALAVIAHAIIGYKFTVNIRSIVSLVGIIVVFVGIVILAYIDSDGWVTAFMILNLILAAIVNAFRAWLRATTSSNMAKFPVRYTGSLSNGLVIGGLIPVLLNILLLSMNINEQMAGAGCFTYAMIMSALCLVAFLYMVKSSYYVHYTNIEKSEKTGKLPKITRDMVFKILSRVWVYALALTITKITTLAIYPGAGSLVEPVNPTDSDWHQIYFTQVTFFLTQNVFAVLGTVSAGQIRRPRGTDKTSQYILLAAAIMRIALVPLIMMCNLAPNNRDHDVLIESDAAFIVLIAVFGLTDGYLVNMCLMFGPRCVDAGMKEVGAAIFIVFNATSATIGTALGNLVVKLL